MGYFTGLLEKLAKKRDSGWEHVERRALERKPRSMSEQEVREVIIPALRRYLAAENKKTGAKKPAGSYHVADGRMQFIFQNSRGTYRPKTVLAREHSTRAGTYRFY